MITSATSGRMERRINMNRILMLSYDNLPDDVKPCFLYLSVFPQDWKMKRSDLTRRWIAEGFVGGRDAEEMVKSNFNELVNRNLIQPRIVRDGKVKRWGVHDLILEIIVKKAVREHFVCIVDKDFRVIPQDHKIRRVSVHEASLFHTWNTTALDLSLTRSLSLSFGSKDELSGHLHHKREGIRGMANVLGGGCTSMRANRSCPPCLDFENMRLLKVLDLGGCWFIDDSHIELICQKLLLLKHLCLRDTGITKLPESIRALQNLQVLDIRDIYVQELPQSLTELKQLSHLLASSRFKGTKLPRGIGSMTSLRVLEAPILCRSGTEMLLEQLGRLVQLQKLVITLVVGTGFASKDVKEKLHAAPQSLGSGHLSSLSISLCDIRRRPRHNSGRGGAYLDDLSSPPLQLETLKLEGGVLSNGVPRWVRSLHGLANISLEITALNQNDIERLKNLSGLLTLRLTIVVPLDEDGDDEQICIGSAGFANLKSFTLEFHCDFRAGFHFERGALPHLQFLNLYYYYYYLGTASVLSGIQNLEKLEEITYKGSESKLRNQIDELRRTLETHPNHPKLSMLPK